MNDLKYLWRMMDANLNRVAEGLRVVEDVLRFKWEDREGCERVKTLRHNVRQTYQNWHTTLLAERNIHTDPGVTVSQAASHELDRKDSEQAFVLANLKRAQEGLRVLEESAHLMGQRDLAKQTERLRFAAYELEFSLLPFFQERVPTEDAVVKKRALPQGLYALTSEPHSLGRSNIEVAREILKAGVKILQYREKTKKHKAMLEECLAIREMAREAGALFIVNDHLDIAVAIDADGVHVGQDDLPVPLVRNIVGPSRIIGLSTHSPEQAQAAVAAGVDYIGVGPIYATQTKTDVCEPVGLEYLKYVVAHIDIPFVAIGGIKEHNVKDVVDAGAQTVALVTEIVGAENITEKVHQIQRILGTI